MVEKCLCNRCEVLFCNVLYPPTERWNEKGDLSVSYVTTFGPGPDLGVPLFRHIAGTREDGSQRMLFAVA